MSSSNALPEEPSASYHPAHRSMFRRKPPVAGEPTPPGAALYPPTQAADILSPVETTQKEMLGGGETYDVSPASSVHDGDLSLAAGPTWGAYPFLPPRQQPDRSRDNVGIPASADSQSHTGAAEREEVARARQAEQWAQQQQAYLHPSAALPHDEISPAGGPYRGQAQTVPPGEGHGQRRTVEEGSTGGRGPFMHYEDYTYFDPNKETDVGGPPRRLGEADTFSIEDPNAAAIPGRSRRGFKPWNRLWPKRRSRKAPPTALPARPGSGGDANGRPRKGAGAATAASSWMPEMLCCLLSIACLAAVAAVLKVYDGRRLADWPLAVSLNTLVAFLTTLCRAAFVVPVVQGLAQLRWNWFARGDKPLADLQVFEDAGRGLPLGALKLLVTARGRLLGMIAAVLLLTGLVTSPLTQAAISNPTRFAPAGVGKGIATIGKIETCSSPGIALTSDGHLDIRQRHAIQEGIFHPVADNVAYLEPTCSSGECRWPAFSSLAICVAANDVTSRLTITAAQPSEFPTSVQNASLPNGAFLVSSASSQSLNMSSVGMDADTGSNPANATLSYSNDPNLIDSAIADILVIYTNQSQASNSSGASESSFLAVEVLLHFCVNTYWVLVTGGVSSTRQISSTTRIISNGSTAGSTGTPAVILAGPEGDARNYTIQANLSRALSQYFADVFVGTYSGNGPGQMGASEILGDAVYQTEGGSQTDTDTDGAVGGAGRKAIGCFFENVAVSLTNSLRRQGVAQSGTALVTETFVSVRWAWLTLLAAQVGLTLGFLTCVMVQTAVWKVAVVKDHGAMVTLLAVTSEDRAVLERYYGLSGYDPNNKAEVSRKTADLTGKFRSWDGGRGWVLTLGSKERGPAEAAAGSTRDGVT